MNQSAIQLRLYKAILLVGAGISVLCVIGNSISGFPLWTDLKWVALFAVVGVAYFMSNFERYANITKFCVFVFLICVFLPFAFIDSGGSENNAIGYAFLLLIVTGYLFSGWQRGFLASALIMVFMALHALEYYAPEIIAKYPARAQFTDRMIQIPLLMLASFWVILRFTKAYEKVNQKLDALAKYDELTGLSNRRMFDKVIDEAFASSVRPIYLAFLDLNNFKKVNDNWGHSIGDEVLRELSVLLKKYFADGGHVVSRWGGDEFAIIYFGEKDALMEKIAGVNAEFNACAVRYEKSAGISISVVSFGDYETIAQMFLAADSRLYEQKRDAQAVANR